MDDNFFKSLTIINSILLGVIPVVFFRRQKLQEIKYKEIMELNIKTHDITKRTDKSLTTERVLYEKDYDRLDYLISRFRKHSNKLSDEIQKYKELWESTIEKGRNGKINEKDIGIIIKNMTDQSKLIRELADKLLK